VPPRDPIDAWNEANAGLIENAADYYDRAIAELSASGPRDWEKRARQVDEVPEDLAEWALSADQILSLVKQGAACDKLWYEFKTWPFGVERPDLTPLRSVSDFLRLRARAAAGRGDEVTYGDSLVVLDRLGRQIMGLSTVLPRLTGISCAASAQEQAIRPFAWSDLDESRLGRYESLLRPLDKAYPDIAFALQTERDAAAWMGMRLSWEGRLLTPPRRLAGEVDYLLDPLMELLAAPLHRQLDPNDPLILEHDARRDAPASWSPPVEFAKIAVASYGRCVVLNARTLLLQRGNRAVRAILDHGRTTGKLPDSLDVFGDAEYMADPFTGRPLIYVRTPDGFKLYSAGLNQADDGGAHHDRFGEGRNPAVDWDYVFWPIPAEISTGGDRP
jgi:hypothetical protein